MVTHIETADIAEAAMTDTARADARRVREGGKVDG